MGRIELQLKRKTIFVWKDDEKLSRDAALLISAEVEEDLNSSRTTEMDIEDDEDYYDEI